jgi:hypothetical protein
MVAEIAFVNDGQIWSARADGSQVRPLTRGAQPAWSPDGARLAYVTRAGDPNRLMVDGKPLAPRRRGVTLSGPKWSPDGATLAYTRFTNRDNDYRTEIVLHDMASGTERVLVELDLFPRFDAATDPDWSPDGATIAYTHSRIATEGRNEIVPDIRTIPVAGGPSKLLIRDAQSPAWSPDGTRIAFAGVRDRNEKVCTSDECAYAGEIYTAAADGSDQRRLTENRGNDADPRWSPDGSRILFSSDRNLPSRGGIWHDSDEVYSIAPDGSCMTWLTNGVPESNQPTWRPASGDRFDPGSCNPDERRPRADPPRLPRLRDGLWLGPLHDGLMLSSVFREGRVHFLFYEDCASFDGCTDSIQLTADRDCRDLPRRPQRRFRMRGALVLYQGRESATYVVSGRTVTGVRHTGRMRLSDVRRIVRQLRPYRAQSARGTLAPPRC